MAKQIEQLIEECKTLVEQSEPFQKKMKAKHSRLKKRVIGHGGQSNTPPFTEKPSMKRSKSAPPIGEGFFSFLTQGPKEKPQKDYKEGTEYNKVYNGIYVGEAPIDGGKLIKSVVDKFDRIIIMSNQVVQVLKNKEQEIPENVIIRYSIEDTLNPTSDEKAKLKQAGKYGQMFLSQNPGAKILFTCSQGLNRSAAAACITMLELGITPDEAIKKVEAARGPKTLTLHGPPQQHTGFIPVIKGQENANVQEHIVKKGSKYCLMSKKTNRNLGCYDSKAGAKKREKQVQYFKHAK